MGQLAGEIVHLSESPTATAVLMTPPYLALRREFFVELAAQIVDRTPRRIRIDWFCLQRGGAFKLLRRWWALRQTVAINSALAQRVGAAASIAITASVGRPHRGDGDLVLGLCEQGAELPEWCRVIRLGGTAN
ncbi:MAG: hypothetical protein MI861_21715 [Pirellulales bacterium]|nr:hypothetical protein [Pirellulales bacterium]